MNINPLDPLRKYCSFFRQETWIALFFALFITSVACFAEDFALDKYINETNSKKSIYEIEADSFKVEAFNEANLTSRNVAFFHANNEIEFIKKTGFGLTRNSGNDKRLLAKVNTSSEETKQFFITTRRDLIGLVTHPKPVVYDAPYKPVSINFMESRVKNIDADPKTKDPDVFETSALKKLDAGMDIVVDASPSKVRIVGSLRAKKECMDCHACKENDLLGAFSYTLLSHEEWLRTEGKAKKEGAVPGNGSDGWDKDLPNPSQEAIQLKQNYEAELKKEFPNFSDKIGLYSFLAQVRAQKWSKATGKDVADWYATQSAKDDLELRKAMLKARTDGGSRYERAVTKHEESDTKKRQ